ncbi:MAG: cyclohexa-1,5-dienecarbonyl-CoA hydratase [Gammaproteobacteria bacterium]|nr:cyclohexa-1,5-dienecarbonyl-CoA hydratase [Gammaproteobacteria bacterium]
MSEPARSWLEVDGRLLRLRLDRPKANIIDAAMIEALQAALDTHLGHERLLAVLLDAEGPHFSYGASVAEHLPARCAAMLQGLHRLILTIAAAPVPVLAAVRGQCLGGGLELALACHLLFVASDATLGQPEMQLGVFAPAASCLLPGLIGAQRAFDLLLSARSLSGTQAAAWGLGTAAGAEPQGAALEYFNSHLAGKSAAAVRHAVRAARGAEVEALRQRLATVERQYLDELMRTHDAVEGLEAFLAKRTPHWEHR